MSKLRLLYTIFAFLIMIILITVSFIYPGLYVLTIIMMIVTIIPIKKMKQKEEKVKLDLLLEYSNTCNTEKYINEARRINKKLLLNRSNKFIEEVNIGLALVGEGEFQKAEELIVRLSKEQSKVNDYALLFYLRLCTDYFFYTNKKDEIKIVVEKIKSILDSSKENIRMQFSIVYLICEAKKKILNNEDLDSIRRFYETLKMPPTTLNLLSKEYILAIIDMRQKNYESAIKKLNNLSEKNYSLIYVKNSKKLLEELKNKNAE